MSNFTKYDTKIRKLENDFKKEKQKQNAPINIFWKPNPGPQTLAFNSEAGELFYGGAGGGGKSDLLEGLAGFAHTKSVIFRRTSTQLTELTDRSIEIFTGRGRHNSITHRWLINTHDLLWNEEKKEWTYSKETKHRSIQFAGLIHEKSKNDWKGRAHDFKGWDELPDFTESQYLFVNGWLRTPIKNQRTRIVAAGNPPTTSDGLWVIKRWAAWLDPDYPYPAKAGELRWFITLEDEDVEREVEGPSIVRFKGVDYEPRSRTFIPALLTDNPYLANSGYRAVLQSLPEPLRSQLLKGDFRIKPTDDDWQVIPTSWVELAFERWRKLTHLERYNLEKQLPSMTGADIAAGGRAKTVIAKRIGSYYHNLMLYQGESTDTGNKAGELIAQAIFPQHLPETINAQGIYVNIDSIAVGKPVYDYLKVLGFSVSGIDFRKKTNAKDAAGRMGFKNIRAWAYWNFREALDPDYGDNIALPPDPELKKELTAPKWKPTHLGAQIEEKDEINSRTGLTQDKADAVVMAYLPPLDFITEDLPESGSYR